MDFYAQAGPLALGTRLRALSGRLTDEATQIYALYGVDVDPRWFPVLYVLGQGERRTVTELARIVGQSHPAVSQVVKAMTSAGLIESVASESDGRVRELGLSPEGRRRLALMQGQLEDVAGAVDALLAQSDDNLWRALADVEASLMRKSLYRRVLEHRRERLAPAVQVRPFVDGDAEAFAALNFVWIERYFRVEDKDREALNDPWGSILSVGGEILMAVDDTQTLGTVAMVPTADSGTVELAKMAVAEQARGLGIGEKLGKAFFARARERGVKRVYLESNTVLKPAMRLYEKLGFVEIEGPDSPYDRCNIQMEKWL